MGTAPETGFPTGMIIPDIEPVQAESTEYAPMYENLGTFLSTL